MLIAMIATGMEQREGQRWVTWMPPDGVQWLFDDVKKAPLDYWTTHPARGKRSNR
jgi:hypothetical protein